MKDLLERHGEALWRAGIEHLLLAAFAVAAGSLAALVVSVLVGRSRRLDTLARFIGGAVTFASPAVLVIALATGPISRTTALTLLVVGAAGQVTRGTLTGLGAVDAAVNLTATAIGMTNRQRIVRVGFPSAWPAMVAAVRWSAFACSAVVLAFPDAFDGGLGSVVRTSTTTRDNGLLAGTIVAAVIVAFVLDLVVRAAGRIVRKP